ncbi:hypothetical protein [Streptomyces sp. NPDC056987]|uniref:hypothetical protein n=1 Tax=Streptomyces sp. NPDC056987 TaxID=3345988 RepID=UPI003630594F
MEQTPMTPSIDPPFKDSAMSDPRVARTVEAFRSALIRMRDGEDLTVEDLHATTELLRMVQATNGTSLAAMAMPLFKEVFQGGDDRR